MSKEERRWQIRWVRDMFVKSAGQNSSLPGVAMEQFIVVVRPWN
jgi:hypothetical protein